jgi:parallel beta-helix repeat protein
MLPTRLSPIVIKASNGYPVHNLDTGLNYTTIQEAIDAPQTLDGHTIVVDAGIYNESVLLNKAVFLIGENKSSTVINGYGAQWTISITANNVTISGFTVKNGGKGLPSPIIPNGGIKLVSNRSTISNNVIVDNAYSGIWSGYFAVSNSNTLENNSVSGNFYGIALSYGSTSNNLTKNIVTNNTYVGIYVNGEGNFLRQNSMDSNVYDFGASGVQDIDESNLIDERPIIYWINEHDRTVPSDAGYVAAINCVNVSITNVSLKNVLTGIEFVNTNSSTIRNAFVLNSSFSNVYLLNSHGNIITDCRLMSNTGRYIYVLALRNSSNNTISDSVIEGGNVIMSGEPYGTGIDLYNSSYNLITRNTLFNNWNAIFLTYSNSNRIYYNNFINNPTPVPIGVIKENSTWDNGYPFGGNYWSDYDGTDLFSGSYQNVTGSDGIGDKPYVIDVGNQQMDKYPLMGMFHSFNTSLGYHVNVISNSTIDDFQYFDYNSTIRILASNMTADQTYGFCRLTIPHSLLSPPYNITINNNPITRATVFENETLSIIYFSYQHSTLEIIIIPEFPSFPILLLFMIATLLAVIAHAPLKRSSRLNLYSFVLLD